MSLTVSQEVNQVNLTVEQNGVSITVQPVLVVASNNTGGGDMLKSVYDPTGVNADAFDIDNIKGIIDGGNATTIF